MPVIPGVFFALAACSVAISQEGLPADASAAATAFLQEIVHESRVPGIQYVVVDSNGIIFDYAGGWADIAGQVPMTSATHLLAYSMTKTLTAAAVLQLADRGKLDLDGSADDYLDTSPYGRSVTIRHLLAHTSGIPNPNPLRWIHLAEARWDSVEEESALRQILKDNAELDRAPGERYAYSNINYWLLGKVIERVSGQSYREYMRDQIFRLLGITDAELGFAMPAPPLGSKGYLARWSLLNVVKGFFVDREVIGEYEEGGWLHIRGHYVNGPAFGGIVGTARGFSKFLGDQLRQRSVLFGARAKTLFFEEQRLSSGKPVPMTLGWHIGELDGRRMFFKEGGGGGFHTEMRLYPERGIATIGITNETSAKIKDYLDALDAMFLKN